MAQAGRHSQKRFSRCDAIQPGVTIEPGVSIDRDERWEFASFNSLSYP